MKKIIVALVLVSGISFSAFAQSQLPPLTKDNMDTYVKQKTQIMSDYLKLTPEQTGKVADINKQVATTRLDNMGSMSVAVIDKKETELYKTVLTPAQQKSWAAHEKAPATK